jgi:drug/metabolite transporter (DMT)-like permease
MTSRQQSRFLIIVAFFAVYFVWGTTYLAIKYAVETIPPFMMMAMRSLSAGAVMYIWGRSRGDADATRKELPSLVLIGFLFFLVGHGGLAWAQKTVPSGVAALLVASEPLMIALLEPLFTRQGGVGKRTLLGMLIGMAGVAVLLLPQGLDFENANLPGTFVILICAFSWSTGAVYSRIAKLPRSSFITGGLQLLSGGVMLIVVSFLLGEWSDFNLSQVSVRSWSGLAYLVLFGSIITFSAYTWLLTITSATRISTHTFINPIIAVLVGWAIGSEALTWEILIAAVLITGAVWIVLSRKTVT